MILIDKVSKRIFESGTILEDGNFYCKERQPGSKYMYQKNDVELVDIGCNVDVYEKVYELKNGVIVEQKLNA